MYIPLKCICRGLIKALPCHPNTPLDIVPLDYVSEAVTTVFFESTPKSRAVYHITAGEQSTPTVQEIVSLTIDRYSKLTSRDRGLSVSYEPALAGGGDGSGKDGGSDRSAKVIEAYAPYIGKQRIFSTRKIERILKPNGIEPPRFSQYFPVVIGHWLRSESSLLEAKAA
jgi:hypothetical protein